jgi:hypothetical protein
MDGEWLEGDRMKVLKIKLGDATTAPAIMRLIEQQYSHYGWKVEEE